MINQQLFANTSWFYSNRIKIQACMFIDVKPVKYRETFFICCSDVRWFVGHGQPTSKKSSAVKNPLTGFHQGRTDTKSKILAFLICTVHPKSQFQNQVSLTAVMISVKIFITQNDLYILTL